MTRDGVFEENRATGAAERISKRDPEPVFTNPHQQDTQQPFTPEPEQLLKPPLPLSQGGAKQDTGTAERIFDRLDIERSRYKDKKAVKKANEAMRRRGENSRLQFTDEERADPDLSRHIRKSDRAADRLDTARDRIPKQKKPILERTSDEPTGKAKVRLHFEETDKKPAHKMKHKPAFVDRPIREAGAAVHGEIQKVEHENAGVEGAHKAEQLAERAGGYAARKVKQGYRSHKMKPYRAAAKAEDAAFKANANVKYRQALRDNPQLAGANPFSKALQKQKIRREYAKALRNGTAQGARGTATTAQKAAKKATKTAQKTSAFIARHKKGFIIAIAAILIFVLLFAGLSSCGAMLQGGFSSIIGTSYTAEDEAITAVDADYVALETALQQRIGNVPQNYPGYDEYRYYVDEIGHDPFELASCLTAKYHDYTREEVQAELQALFAQQYTLTITEVIEVRYRTETYTDTWTDPETGETYSDTYTVEVPYHYYILNVSLTNKALGRVVAENLTAEQLEMYAVYMDTFGNKPYLFADNPYVNRGEYTDYDIPPEALTDERFASMIAEAEKYLGYPYVWGGSRPSTSFDCSGFACWVINQSGVGSVGRTTANGLFNHCAIIPASEAKPGDLIFFQGTYNTAGASHVGIYVGGGMMIHCGNPISYASVNTTYWTNHFYAYGRLP